MMAELAVLDGLDAGHEERWEIGEACEGAIIAAAGQQIAEFGRRQADQGEGIAARARQAANPAGVEVDAQTLGGLVLIGKAKGRGVQIDALTALAESTDPAGVAGAQPDALELEDQVVDAQFAPGVELQGSGVDSAVLSPLALGKAPLGFPIEPPDPGQAEPEAQPEKEQKGLE
jgi:hypothetical protein